METNGNQWTSEVGVGEDLACYLRGTKKFLQVAVGAPRWSKMYQVTSKGAPKSQSHICPANLRSPLRAESCWDLLRSAESWDIWRWSLESLEVWWSLGVADVVDVAVYSKGTLWDSSHSCCFVGFSFWFSLDAYPHLSPRICQCTPYDRWKPSPVLMETSPAADPRRSARERSRSIALISASRRDEGLSKHWLTSRWAPLLVQVLVNHASSKSK